MMHEKLKCEDQNTGYGMVTGMSIAVAHAAKCENSEASGRIAVDGFARSYRTTNSNVYDNKSSSNFRGSDHCNTYLAAHDC